MRSFWVFIVKIFLSFFEFGLQTHIFGLKMQFLALDPSREWRDGKNELLGTLQVQKGAEILTFFPKIAIFQWRPLWWAKIFKIRISGLSQGFERPQKAQIVMILYIFEENIKKIHFGGPQNFGLTFTLNPALIF